MPCSSCGVSFPAPASSLSIRYFGIDDFWASVSDIRRGQNRRLLSQRGLAQLEPKAGALAGLRFKADAAIHAFDAFADQGEADAGPRIRFLGVESLEKAKDLL